jgi:hypothetical protein
MTQQYGTHAWYSSHLANLRLSALQARGFRHRESQGVSDKDPRFGDRELLSFLEQRRLPYIVVARMTKWVQRAAQRVEQWQMLDENYAIGEFRLQLWGWKTERRFIAVRECVRESRHSLRLRQIGGGSGTGKS